MGFFGVSPPLGITEETRIYTLAKKRRDVDLIRLIPMCGGMIYVAQHPPPVWNGMKFFHAVKGARNGPYRRIVNSRMFRWRKGTFHGSRLF